MTIPKYPDDIQFDTDYDECEAKRAYWEAVARLALETIQYQFSGTTHWQGCEDRHWECRLLEEIGKLPDKESP